jgi:hypothetical protein
MLPLYLAVLDSLRPFEKDIPLVIFFSFHKPYILILLTFFFHCEFNSYEDRKCVDLSDCT